VQRERPRLSLDLLERYGTDLLEALVGLEKAGIDHRDIKPANLGVREQRGDRGDRAQHRVLFDFLAARAGASTAAGTPPYLDPFLGTAARPHWDSAAERYARGGDLFEMATGRPPATATAGPTRRSWPSRPASSRACSTRACRRRRSSFLTDGRPTRPPWRI
jgi:serine/threonine protein kinase